MDKQKRSNYFINASIIIFFLISILLRWLSLPNLNVDMTQFYLKFYNYIAEHGFSAMGDNFSLAPPLHLYLIWLATLMRGFLGAPTALKLISIAFDLLSAVAVYKIVRIKYTSGNIPLLASALFLTLPTVIMNSSLWGQIDSLYTSFLLWCVYFLLKEHPLAAMIAFGLSVSFKLQAIFLLPFLAIMVFKRRIPWYYVLVSPLVYVLTIIPAVLAGRPFFEALTIYLSWSNEFPQLAMHASNLYSLVVGHPRWVLPIYYGGLAMAVIFISGWIVYYARRRFALSPRLVLFTALMSVVLVPFLLPKMHDRYFYPADNLSYVLAFFWPGAWYIALGYQVISGLVYFIFLHSVGQVENRTLLTLSVLLNTLMVAHLVIRQWLETRKEASGD